MFIDILTLMAVLLGICLVVKYWAFVSVVIAILVIGTVLYYMIEYHKTQHMVKFDSETETKALCYLIFIPLLTMIATALGLVWYDVSWKIAIPVWLYFNYGIYIMVHFSLTKTWIDKTIGEPDNILPVSAVKFDE